jgi:RNA polymerase sigma factor FliA
VAADEIQVLWRRFKRAGDKSDRDRLILTYAPLVKYVAGRLGSRLPAHVEEADLISSGLLGLISAIERYDPDRDFKFETYAFVRIRGAIIDGLRTLDWGPRSVRTRAREIERAIATLEATLERSPTDEEIAQKLGISEDELEASLIDISRSSIAALDEIWAGGDEGDTSLLDTIEDTNCRRPAEAFDETELREAIADAVARLPERETLVITLYYYEELTLREIGEVLGVTESRVCQMHTKAMLRLRSRFSLEPAIDGTAVEQTAD